MNKAIAILPMAIVVAALLNYLTHMIYVDQFIFAAGTTEWNAAHARGDMDSMWAAYHKEERAQICTFDPRGWFAVCP